MEVSLGGSDPMLESSSTLPTEAVRGPQCLPPVGLLSLSSHVSPLRMLQLNTSNDRNASATDLEAGRSKVRAFFLAHTRSLLTATSSPGGERGALRTLFDEGPDSALMT